MTADLLRRAAAKIRETAQAADAQMRALDWTWGPDIDGALGGEAGTHAALWSPDVAELVATLIESEANEADALKGYAPEDVVALARLILGEQP
ncbi:hypothetical protein ACWHA6_36270 [Streptomyces anthocyanicus]